MKSPIRFDFEETVAYVLTLESGFDDMVGYELAVEYGKLCSGREKRLLVRR